MNRPQFWPQPELGKMLEPQSKSCEKTVPQKLKSQWSSSVKELHWQANKKIFSKALVLFIFFYNLTLHYHNYFNLHIKNSVEEDIYHDRTKTRFIVLDSHFTTI